MPSVDRTDSRLAGIPPLRDEAVRSVAQLTCDGRRRRDLAGAVVAVVVAGACSGIVATSLDDTVTVDGIERVPARRVHPGVAVDLVVCA